MLPEILNIPIPIWIQNKTPSDYKGYRDAINKSNIEQQKIEKYLNEANLKRRGKEICSDMGSTDDEANQLGAGQITVDSASFAIRHFSDMTESSQSSFKGESLDERNELDY